MEQFFTAEFLTSWGFLSPALIVASAALLIAIERVFPYDKGMPILRGGITLDLVFYALLQGTVLALLIRQLIAYLDATTGWSTHGIISDWPVWVQVSFFVVTHDLYIYLFHRWQHNNPRLWRLHEAHHSSENIDWIAGSRSHPLEIIINQTIEFAPIVLLGAHPDVAAIKGLLSASWGMYIHSNINAPKTWLSYILCGPEMHRWHHATDVDAYDLNFGTKFAFWDVLLGTFFVPDPKVRKPKGYGLTDVDFPEDYMGQVKAAFRPFEEPTNTDSAKAA